METNIIPIQVRNKIATVPEELEIVCGNTDYVAVFDLDEEWGPYSTKTARFTSAKGFIDVVFVGITCPVPAFSDVTVCKIGVYAGDLHTTTPAYIRCRKSILCDGKLPCDPTPDVYKQIMELLSTGGGGGGGFTTDETLTLKNGILSVNTAKEVEADNTLPVTSAAVNTTVGNIEILLATI